MTIISPKLQKNKISSVNKSGGPKKNGVTLLVRMGADYDVFE